MKEKLEVEEAYINLLAEKKSLEEKLENTEPKSTNNFHNIEAYSSFSDYFANVGHQDVLPALCVEYPELDLTPLTDKFPPIELEKDGTMSLVPMLDFDRFFLLSSM
ncbi:hypothetical protein Adt_05836 [Abeliophyllum distichum]|uniref:Uncharacterized protein n=1 Tax=Abeliophyllum distichum TaxID=126358 RepID=A0ABD1V577_9LAMI